MQEAPEKKLQEKPKIGQIVLWVLVILSLSLNGVTIYALLQARNAAVAAVASAQVTIARISQEPIRTVVSINQDIPIDATLPLNKTFVVPLNFEYPLSTVVNTTINIPVLGPQELAIPIETIIPIQYEVEIPVQTEIPISLTYPLKLDVPIEVAIPADLMNSIEGALQSLVDAIP